ncbi:MAG: hypothetical protein AMK72_08380 [Planctomycetes bacterium SM23_25]|nr:MAG: hypothetical protein AMK72_08380 [Planctomycetes bacterium SM23_25]
MMTSVGRYRGMGTVLDRLDAVRRRHLLVVSGEAAAGLVTLLLGGLVALAAVGFWPGQPPAALRWSLLIGMLALWTAGLAWFALLPVRRRLNYRQTARLIEQEIEGLENGLINALQLSADRMQVSPVLVASAIQETARRTTKAPLASAVKMQSLRRWSIAAGAAAAALLIFALAGGPQFSRGLAAVFDPTGYVPHVGSVKLISLTPGDTTCFAGEDLTVVARIHNPRRRDFKAHVEIAGRAAALQAFTSPDRTTFSCPLGKAEESFQYALRIGDSKFPADRPYYAVKVLQRVTVQGLDLRYTFPAYIERKSESVVNAAGPIEAPLGTTVEAILRLSAHVPAAVLETRSGKKTPMPADSTGKSFSGMLHVTADDAYRIVLTDEAGRSLGQLPDLAASAALGQDTQDGYYRIRAVPDAPPKIAFIAPNRDVAVGPGGKLATQLKASDDYGLAALRFFVGREGEPARLEHVFDQARGKTKAELDYTVEIGPQYRQGEVLVYYAAAADGRNLGRLGGPQTTETPRFKILIQDPAEVAAEQAKRYDELRRRLLAILAAQEAQRVNTEIAARKLTDLVQVRATGGQIAAGQQAIKTDMLDVVDHFSFQPEMVTIQQALALLANNEAALAVTQAGVLAGLPDMDGRGKACEGLAATQDKIIRALQTLLAILPTLTRPEAARRTAPGEDLPPEVREKLTDLKGKLEEFIDQQRKIIDSGDRLTKRPVDNFTAEDEKLLKDLELAQDKWEKFLNEKFADFSKLAQQDFSKPSMLKELISVKTDVTMAKDALNKKAIEIATAIEDNGIENAKTLTANIEKWLPDEPDRIKWDMEDPTGQTNIEQPELPKELEDLVGDLLEEEEDLFEEMDDITAKYAMSGDKGIGWDAMDGPISNMNAQGVTGNQLPNTSEISGRSGEGRQGKSLGEFVEDKAVGKGGRRTPTRLTPEPFQQGQIDDISQEPAGGATGGGKLSGAGAEGLEGPLPPELQTEPKRLAGRHAQLRNKAERLQANFKVTDFSNYQFLQAITLMNRVQRDLEDYRYTNVLRQRHVTLAALRRTQLLLAGKIDVTEDATANMPKHVKDDIADAMKAKLPPEYREALRRYFTRLAETGKE